MNKFLYFCMKCADLFSHKYIRDLVIEICICVMFRKSFRQILSFSELLSFGMATHKPVLQPFS